MSRLFLVVNPFPAIDTSSVTWWVGGEVAEGCEEGLRAAMLGGEDTRYIVFQMLQHIYIIFSMSLSVLRFS